MDLMRTTRPECAGPESGAEIRTGHLWVYRGELGEVVYDFTLVRQSGRAEDAGQLPWVFQVDGARLQ